MRYSAVLTLSVMGMDPPTFEINNRDRQLLEFELADELSTRKFANPNAEVAVLHRAFASIRKIIAAPYERGTVGTRTKSSGVASCIAGALETAGCLMPSTNLLVRDGSLRLFWPVCSDELSEVRVERLNPVVAVFSEVAKGEVRVDDLDGGDYRWEIVNDDFIASARFRVAKPDQLRKIDTAIAQVREVEALPELAVFREAAVLISWGAYYDAHRILKAEARRYPGYSLVSGWLDAVEMELEKGTPECAE